MTLLAGYLDAKRDEDVARLRRIIALRAMTAGGMSQREVATALGISQSAVSQQLKSDTALHEADPQFLIEAAAPILKALTLERGYRRLAVFGSVGRGTAGLDSDIDLIVEAPPGTSSFDFVRLQQLIEKVLGREIDLVDYGGLTPGIDDDVLRDSRAL